MNFLSFYQTETRHYRNIDSRTNFKILSKDSNFRKAIFKALSNDYFRTIMNYTIEKPKSVVGIVKDCDIPMTSEFNIKENLTGVTEFLTIQRDIGVFTHSIVNSKSKDDCCKCYQRDQNENVGFTTHI